MSLPSGGFLAEDVYDRTPQGIIGGRATSSPNDITLTLVNSDPQASQVDTIVVDTAANLTEYSFTIAGETISFTSDASGAKEEISAGLLLAFNASPIAGGLAQAVDDGVDTLTITGNNPGQSYTVATSDANLTAASVTSAAEAEAVEFGRCMVADSYDANENLLQGRMAKSSFFTAQVMTGSFTYVSGKIIRCLVVDKHSGATIADASFIQATNLATSITGLVAQLNAQLPANSVLATAAATDFTLTSELAGFEFDASMSSDDSANVLETIAYTTGPTESTSLLRAFKGVSLFDPAQEATSIGGNTANYPENAGVTSLNKGGVWVSNSQTIVAGGQVFVEMDGTGSDFAKFFNTNSATRLLMPRGMARWERSTISSTAALAVVTVDAYNQPA